MADQLKRYRLVIDFEARPERVDRIATGTYTFLRSALHNWGEPDVEPSSVLRGVRELSGDGDAGGPAR